MGVTFTKVRVSNPRQRRRAPTELEFLVDTGAIYSVIPESTARKLGLEEIDHEEFTLADGSHYACAVGEAFFEMGDRRGTSKVAFGPPDVFLLGALTLESLGLMVNPITREVQPMRLFLARNRPQRDGGLRRHPTPKR